MPLEKSVELRTIETKKYRRREKIACNPLIYLENFQKLDANGMQNCCKSLHIMRGHSRRLSPLNSIQNTVNGRHGFQ